ncbi:MAG TPA: O-methyltransferase [Bacillota bacterium]|nr:O-methyltransferase [Bacillota bacterium]
MKQNIEHYLQRLLPIQETFIKRIKNEAQETHIPIMEETSLQLLTVLIRLHQPKRILEIGTGIGYSTIRMAEVCSPCEIITIEKDEKRFTHAVKTISDYQTNEQIKIVQQDALQYLANYEGEKFDFIFIDAAKSKYKQFFQLADQCLHESGLIVTDNVLFRGYVINSTNIPKRYKTIVNSLQQFNEWLANHPKYVTTFVPIGDGIAVSLKLPK